MNIQLFIDFINKSSVFEKIGFFYTLLNTYKLLNYVYSVNLIDLRSFIFHFIKKIPYVKNKIINEKLKFTKKLKDELNSPINKNKLIVYNKLLHQGLDDIDIINHIKHYYKLGKYDFKKGKVSGTVYTSDTKLDNLMNTIFPIFYRSNPLHPDIFPGIRKMEAEIIHMCANILNSNDPCAGSFTSGGTESIILAMRTYRDFYSKTNPNIIVCKTGHAAYWKAGQYLDINIIEAPYDEEGKLTLKNIKKLINNNTIAVITSAPSFNFGIIDDIKEISEYCFKKNISVHVDMCLGGFILPFIEGYKHISFLSNGVTSISLDTHKYGCGPKGGSVILYKNTNLYKKQIFVKENWSGGIYGTSNISGSRCGNSISLTWASLMYHGFNGFKKNAETIIDLTNFLFSEISKIDGIFVYGKPKICIVSIGSKLFDIYLLSDKLNDLGWNLNVLQNPSCFHICITNCHNRTVLEKFIQDIKKSIEEIKELIGKNKTLPVSKSLYGSTQKINDSSIVSDVVRDYFCCLNDIL